MPNAVLDIHYFYPAYKAFKLTKMRKYNFFEYIIADGAFSDAERR